MVALPVRPRSAPRQMPSHLAQSSVGFRYCSSRLCEAWTTRPLERKHAILDSATSLPTLI
jgi:hypothetical protein